VPRHCSAFSLAFLFGLTSAAAAHPVAKNTHDRKIDVEITKKDEAGQATVRVKYRLEVDEWTVFNKDLEPYADDIDAFQYRGKPLALYTEFARRLGPDLAFRLAGKANGKRLDFRCVEHEATLHDKDRTPLGHLRCDFTFETSFAILPGQNELTFRDNTYLGEEGKIEMNLAIGTGLAIRSKVVPDEAVKKRSLLEREAGDDEKLRTLSVVFIAEETATLATATAAKPQTVEAPAQPRDDHSLLRLLLHADYGFLLTILMAVAFGAAHALTPGHGKTLVAAYLVGERGTTWHAVVLGIVTTLTHTAIVLLIAVVLFFLPGEARDSFGRVIQDGLGLAMGLLVVCMGFWLLLQRLSGRADHVHVGGGHHHHREEGVRGQGSGVRTQRSGVSGEPSEVAEGTVRWWGLIMLGITGGLVPCWDAIYLLLYTVGRSQFMLALPAVLAFSAGLASVLVLIGILVVQVPRFARSRWGHGAVVRALPIASAVVVTLMGLWLCYEGVHGNR
jgi:ABC-type nickel/cobalt efflux system permease component RcnA